MRVVPCGPLPCGPPWPSVSTLRVAVSPWTRMRKTTGAVPWLVICKFWRASPEKMLTAVVSSRPGMVGCLTPFQTRRLGTSLAAALNSVATWHAPTPGAVPPPTSGPEA